MDERDQEVLDVVGSILYGFAKDCFSCDVDPDGVNCGPYNVVTGLYEVALSIRELAKAVLATKNAE